MRKVTIKIRFISLAIVFVAFALATSTYQLYKSFKRVEADVLRLRKFTEVIEGGDLQPQHVVRKRSPGVNGGGCNQEHLSSTLTGTTYVRWGRRDCPDAAETHMLYEGYTTGSYHAHVGGGSDFLCLHHNVTYTPGHFIDGNQGAAHAHGAEYRSPPAFYSLFDLSLIEDRTLQYHGVPCAVCFVRSSSQLMIPSRETCPEGWRMEYTGYIMTGGYSDTKHSSSFLCVDDTPQAIPNTSGNQNGAYLHVVEITCAHNTPCGPYVDRREIRCVVCTYHG